MCRAWTSCRNWTSFSLCPALRWRLFQAVVDVAEWFVLLPSPFFLTNSCSALMLQLVIENIIWDAWSNTVIMDNIFVLMVISPKSSYHFISMSFEWCPKGVVFWVVIFYLTVSFSFTGASLFSLHSSLQTGDWKIPTTNTIFYRERTDCERDSRGSPTPKTTTTLSCVTKNVHFS